MIYFSASAGRGRNNGRPWPAREGNSC